MNLIKAYSSNSAKIGVDGVPLAGTVLAEERERCSEYPVLGFGDSAPSSILTFNRHYVIVLERETAVGDGVALDCNGSFELQIGDVIYSGCRCTEIGKIKKPDGSEKQKITIIAPARQEAAADE